MGDWREWIVASQAMSMEPNKKKSVRAAIVDTVDTNQIITALAYEYWQRRGCPIGSPELDWFKAEEYLNSWLQAEEDAKKRTESIREGGVIAINDLRR
jgi:hypothetical protein